MTAFEFHRFSECVFAVQEFVLAASEPSQAQGNLTCMWLV